MYIYVTIYTHMYMYILTNWPINDTADKELNEYVNCMCTFTILIQLSNNYINIQQHEYLFHVHYEEYLHVFYILLTEKAHCYKIHVNVTPAER